MKNLLKILLGLSLVLFAISCNNDDATEIIPVQQLQDVVFDINNFIPDASKNLFVSKDNLDNDPLIPDCSDLEPSYVVIDISGTEYTLQLVTLNDKTETEVVKLPAGPYVINEFIVYAADGTAIWASPMMGSYYQNLWQLRGVNQLEFIVLEFEKLKVELDVLCYRPYDYERFGFAWFAYTKIEIHTVCFFGDICTKFYEEFHAEGSPYFGQDYDGYDFPAIFYVNVKNEAGAIVNDNTPVEGVFPNSNLSWFGLGSPLCIEYPDVVGVPETFTFEIMLKMPSGAWELVYTGGFDDTAMSNNDGLDGFGGTDGVFDFVVGNCSYDGNDANVELPAYLPIPISADMVTSWGPQGFDIFEFYMTFSNYNPGPIPGLFDEATYRTLCGEEEVNIIVPGNYFVEFYSSLDYLEPTSLIPAPYNAYPWGSMNYLANNCGIVDGIPTTYTWQEVQEAVWYIMDPDNTVLGVNNQLAQDSMANADFVPSVGDFACVLVVPFEITNGTRAAAATASQLLLMRIDP
ncbi:hypothetical protein [uncultured Lutibacter sp.]|uniref:hypothetical protein n=1 Tax=uncultured Lutibacter sp. TaxID=437739 RepID=UPI002620949F|nr:hypothetical protein [uncultured Lutibacter sp.]